MTFEALYRKYFYKLTNYSYQIVGDWADAKDCVQDVFTRFNGADIRQYETENVLLTWLFTSTRNRSLNWLQRRKRIIEVESKNKLPKYEYEESPEHAFIRAEVIRQLYEHIEQLPPECKKIIKLYYKNGYNSGEIANMLGLHVSTVKNQTRRGVLLLKQRYKVASKYQSL